MLTPYPERSALIKDNRQIDPFWETWLRDLIAAVNFATPVAHVFEASVSASQTAEVVFQTPIRVEAVYVVEYTMRVTQAAGASSSLTFTLEWMAGGVAQSQAGAALTGNLTTTQQNGVFVIRADAQTNIAYSTAYASAGSPSMHYTLDVLVTQQP